MNTEMDDCGKFDLEFEDDGLIDDNQFSEISVGFNTNELVGGLNIDANENEKLSELQESTEPLRNQKKGRYNLRKSLAWDSAFFTSAGVLDAEELTTMITGADKCEKRLLPRIQEELTESTESFSSLASDTLTMETLEDDSFFIDIEDPIQRSSKRAMDMRILNSNTAAMVVDSTDISSLEKEEPVTQIKAIAINEKTPKPGLKKSSSLPSEKISKCLPKQNIGTIGSGKAIKQDPAVPSQAPVAKTGETKSILLKAPKAVNRPIPSSTVVGKRESIGTGRARSASGISNSATVSGKGPQPPKVSSLGGPRRGALPKSSLSSSSSLLTSSITSSVHSTRSSTSSDSSSNMTSRINPAKSNLMTPRRNTGKSGDVGTGHIPKTPSRATLKNKIPSSSSTLSAYMTANKISSSVLPASSISEWSSVSSSSSTMVNRKSNTSRTSIDANSRRSSMKGGVTPLEPRNYPAEQKADEGQKIQGVGLTSNNLKKSSMQSGSSLLAPAKPSGLRMPSHKFGFFDGGKLSTRSPNRPQQSPSAVNNGIPKNSIPIRTSNSKQKSAKAPSTRMGTSPAGIKPSSPKPASMASLNPSSPKFSYQASSQQKSHTLADTSIVSKGVVKSPILSVEVKGGSASEEARQEAEKVETRNVVTQVVANTGGTIIEESLGELKLNNALGYDVVVDKSQLVKDFEPTCKATEKENGYDKSTHHKVNGSIDEHLGDMSLCRAPFTLKNSFTSDECLGMQKEFVTHVSDKSGFLLLESEPKGC